MDTYEFDLPTTVDPETWLWRLAAHVAGGGDDAKFMALVGMFAASHLAPEEQEEAFVRFMDRTFDVLNGAPPSEWPPGADAPTKRKQAAIDRLEGNLTELVSKLNTGEFQEGFKRRFGERFPSSSTEWKAWAARLRFPLEPVYQGDVEDGDLLPFMIGHLQGLKDRQPGPIPPIDTPEITADEAPKKASPTEAAVIRLLEKGLTDYDAIAKRANTSVRNARKIKSLYKGGKIVL